MKIENAEWNHPSVYGRPLSESVKALRAIQPGEVKRIFHDDVTCKYKRGGGCSLYQESVRLRERGWVVESYHENDGVMVVRRLK